MYKCERRGTIYHYKITLPPGLEPGTYRLTADRSAD